MNELIKKNYNKIFLFFLYMQPIIDAIIGIGLNYFNINISIGIIIRMTFLLFIIYSGVFVYKDRLKSKIIYLVLVLLYIIIYVVNILIYKDMNAIIYEIQNLIKVLYLPCMIICISRINIGNKHLIRILTIYSLFIIVPTFLKINLEAYTQGKVGSSGFFNSANEISAIFTILIPILVVYILNKKWKNKAYLINFIPIFMIGSKNVILALILTISITLIYYPVNWYKKRNLDNKNNKIDNSKIIKNIVIAMAILIVVIIGTILILPKTSLYKNIVIHLDFLEINTISDVCSYKFINRFIFSDRLDFLTNTNKNYMNANFIQKIFGIGYIENYDTDQETFKLIEMDVFDIFYRLGIIGFAIFWYPIIEKLKYIVNNRKNIKLEYILSGILILMLSMFVGHTIVAPAVSIYIVIILEKCIGNKNMVNHLKYKKSICEEKNENRICNSKL